MASSFLDFVEMQTSTKTRVFYIQSKRTLNMLGEIRWYTPWRKYCFNSLPNIVFDAKCLHDITMFLNQLMEDRLPKEGKPAVTVGDVKKFKINDNES